MTPRRLISITAFFATAGLAACSDTSEPQAFLSIADGNPEQGKRLIHAYGCGTCHEIEGIRGARGKVGPRLENYARQHLLAGFLPNAPRYLIAWLVDPVALNPQTGMPSQGLSEPEARHVASYLYTLGSDGSKVYPPDPPLPLRGQDQPAARTDAPPAEQSETTPRTRRIIP